MQAAFKAQNQRSPALAIQREPMKETNPLILPLASVLQDETPSLPDAPKVIDGGTEEFIPLANTQPAVIGCVFTRTSFTN